MCLCRKRLHPLFGGWSGLRLGRRGTGLWFAGGLLQCRMVDLKEVSMSQMEFMDVVTTQNFSSDISSLLSSRHDHHHLSFTIRHLSVQQH